MKGTDRPTGLSRARVAAVSLTALIGLAACTGPVDVEHAPFSSDPACGLVLQSTPDELAGLDRRGTTSQGSTAWGDDAITMRCGIELPPPTTDRCLSVTLPDGEVHDWISVEEPGEEAEKLTEVGGWVLRTYGREPALEVVIPSGALAEDIDPGQVLASLAPPVEATEQYSQCVGATDLEPDTEL